MNHSLVPMFFAMILSGLLTTMNVWTDNISNSKNT